MKTLTDHLANYAAYHRDVRNIATHFVGVPMIVLAVVVLLSRPVYAWGAWPITPAMLVALLTVLFYLRLDLRLGALMAALLASCLVFGSWVAAQSTLLWLSLGLGLFVLGWIIQFIGHYYEGRKPAFVDDLFGLIIAPLFVVAEVLFALGLRLDLQRAIEVRVGPTRKRDLRAA